MLRIIQYRQKCIGCNACVEADSSRWRISRHDGKATLIGGTEKKGIFSVQTAEYEFDFISMAARNCPVSCIRIENASSTT